MKGLFILAASAAMTVSSVAFAADAVETVPAAPEAVMPVFTWAGPYVGLHGGYGWADGDIGPFDENFDGGRFGGFVGYNWQLSSGFVAGIEGDLNYDWNEQDVGGVDVDTGFAGGIRGRVGFAFDRALLYAAGGWTMTRTHADSPIDDDDTIHGWTVGGGLDYAITDNVFARVEYRYNDYRDGDIGGLDVDLRQHVVNAGIGVKF